MSTLDCIGAAFHALRANVLRSVLTALGIIIGVAAVIVMVAVGAGAESRVRDVIKSLGANLMFIVPGSGASGGARLGRGTVLSLTEDDAAAIRADIPSVLYAAPSVRGSGQVVYGNLNWSTTIYGITPDNLDAREWVIDGGRRIRAEDLRAAGKVALLGATVREKLFGDGDPVGQSIRIKRVPFKVVGTLREKGETPMGRDQDDVIFVPLSTAKKRVIGGRRISGRLVSMIVVKVRNGDELEEAEVAITELLRQRHRIRPGDKDDFGVRNLAELLQKREESSRIMSLLLAAVASISLIVGGIGIMNIMLVSVTERTREIGLRMAVGASGRDVLAQFLTEAVVLAVVGGIVGIAIGLVGAQVSADIAGWPMLVQGNSVLLAVGVSGVVGVFFGFYPARKAARLNPIDALRHE
ncbi:MAG: ABC transporter permease [Alphaproteobacteria bacterium]|jgi:putative ABC transport system permease protein|nr:ABC transporter permease [Alphaproteobacteria bacterium]MDP6811901.1 ABC transporter permease [Alphaproteobacteria bacterium]